MHEVPISTNYMIYTDDAHEDYNGGRGNAEGSLIWMTSGKSLCQKALDMCSMAQLADKIKRKKSNGGVFTYKSLDWHALKHVKENCRSETCCKKPTYQKLLFDVKGMELDVGQRLNVGPK